MKRLREYLKERNIPEDSLEANSILEGYEKSCKDMVERLRELKNGYEKDLDAEPRVYERDIQLCAKISLIDRIIIIELEGKL
jgi:hypothetical protein